MVVKWRWRNDYWNRGIRCHGGKGKVGPGGGGIGKVKVRSVREGQSF